MILGNNGLSFNPGFLLGLEGDVCNHLDLTSKSRGSPLSKSNNATEFEWPDPIPNYIGMDQIGGVCWLRTHGLICLFKFQKLELSAAETSQAAQTQNQEIAPKMMVAELIEMGKFANYLILFLNRSLYN